MTTTQTSKPMEYYVYHGGDRLGWRLVQRATAQDAMDAKKKFEDMGERVEVWNNYGLTRWL